MIAVSRRPEYDESLDSTVKVDWDESTGGRDRCAEAGEVDRPPDEYEFGSRPGVVGLLRSDE